MRRYAALTPLVSLGSPKCVGITLKGTFYILVLVSMAAQINCVCNTTVITVPPPSPTAMAAAHSPHANTCPSCVSRLNGMNGLGLGAGQVWGGGLALRGPDGSMVNVCDGMVAERKQVHPDPSSSRVSAARAPSPPHSTTPRALPLAAVGVLCLAPARAVAFRAGATQRAPRGGAQVFVSFAIGLVAFLWVVSPTRGHCIAP